MRTIGFHSTGTTVSGALRPPVGHSHTCTLTQAPPMAGVLSNGSVQRKGRTYTTSEPLPLGSLLTVSVRLELSPFPRSLQLCCLKLPHPRQTRGTNKKLHTSRQQLLLKHIPLAQLGQRLCAEPQDNPSLGLLPPSLTSRALL